MVFDTKKRQENELSNNNNMKTKLQVLIILYSSSPHSNRAKSLTLN